MLLNDLLSPLLRLVDIQVLALHLIPEAVRQKGLLNGAQFSTFADESVTVVEGGSNTRFSAGGATARVTNADLLSCSGVVHVIDTILVAPDMYADDTSATGTGTPPEIFECGNNSLGNRNENTTHG